MHCVKIKQILVSQECNGKLGIINMLITESLQAWNQTDWLMYSKLIILTIPQISFLTDMALFTI